MFNGTVPCWIPRTPVGDHYEARLRVTPFGDGYAQRVLDGINNVDIRWSLTWEMLAEPDLFAMDAYLSQEQGNAFQFRHPMTLEMHFVICDEWTIEWVWRRREVKEKAGEGVSAIMHYGTMTAEFIKFYGVTG